MTVTIPDEALSHLDLTPEQARLELAIGLFAANKVSTARGARIAGLTYLEFQRELGRRHIPVHYGIEELEKDLATIGSIPAR